MRFTLLYDSIHPLPIVAVGGDSVPVRVVVCGFKFVVVRGSCGGCSVDKVKKLGVECVAFGKQVVKKLQNKEWSVWWISPTQYGDKIRTQEWVVCWISCTQCG